MKNGQALGVIEYTLTNCVVPLLFPGVGATMAKSMIASIDLGSTLSTVDEFLVTLPNDTLLGNYKDTAKQQQWDKDDLSQYAVLGANALLLLMAVLSILGLVCGIVPGNLCTCFAWLFLNLTWCLSYIGLLVS